MMDRRHVKKHRGDLIAVYRAMKGREKLDREDLQDDMEINKKL